MKKAAVKRRKATRRRRPATRRTTRGAAAPSPPPPPAPPSTTTPQTIPADSHTWKLVDRDQLAMLLGVHPDTISDFTREGMPVLERGGRGAKSTYEAVACLTWWRTHSGMDAKEAAQARAYAATADLNELRALEKRGQVISRDEVVREGQIYTRAWASKVRGVPRQLLLAGLITLEQVPVAENVCRDILLEIASWQPVPGEASPASADEDEATTTETRLEPQPHGGALKRTSTVRVDDVDALESLDE